MVQFARYSFITLTTIYILTAFWIQALTAIYSAVKNKRQ